MPYITSILVIAEIAGILSPVTYVTDDFLLDSCFTFELYFTYIIAGVLNKIWLNTQIFLCSNIFFPTQLKDVYVLYVFRDRRWISYYIEMSLLP